MNVATQVLAVVEALIYIAVAPLEALFLGYPAVQRFLSTPERNVPAVMMWAIPTGVRNLLIGLGVIGGVVALHTGYEAEGRALVLFGCAYMVIAGASMGVADLRGHYPRRGDSVPGTLAATVPALLALVVAAF